MNDYRRHGGQTVWACFILVGLVAGAASASDTQEEMIASSMIEGRRIVMPPDLAMTLDWYAPVVHSENCRITRGWVRKDVILLETDRGVLICVERKDGTERWRCDLLEPMRYEPSVSRNNVLINVKNYLVAIHKTTGKIRWRLLPKFVMSCPVLIIDPPEYPKTYTRKWQDLESLYTASWHGRMYAISVQARTGFMVGSGSSRFPAPAFTIFEQWHKTHRGKGVVTTPIRIYDETLYYAASDAKVRGVNRDSEPITPYLLQDAPATAVTVNALNCYVGCRDLSLYALDRLTLRKKWSYALGTTPAHIVYADQPAIVSYVFVPTETDGIHAVRVHGTHKRGQIQMPEAAEFAWKAPKLEGIIGASKEIVYMGEGLHGDFDGYRTIHAVDKETGKVRWQSASKGVRFYIQFHNVWKKEDQAFRLYAVTADNRLLAFKETVGGAGPLAEKVVKDPVKKPAGDGRVPGAAQANPD